MMHCVVTVSSATFNMAANPVPISVPTKRVRKANFTLQLEQEYIADRFLENRSLLSAS